MPPGEAGLRVRRAPVSPSGTGERVRGVPKDELSASRGGRKSILSLVLILTESRRAPVAGVRVGHRVRRDLYKSIVYLRAMAW